jgi:large repetitive protein
MRIHQLIAVVLFSLVGISGHAAEQTWTGGGGLGTSSWQSPLNWGGATIAANDALTFPNVTYKTAINNAAANTPFGPLTFNASGYVVTGTIINLNSGIFLNGANIAQVALPLQISSPLAFNVSNNSGILTLTQPISGAGGIIKSGGGLMILNGNHTYTGPTIIQGGGLEVGGSLTGEIQISTGFLVGTGAVDGVTSLNLGSASIAPGTAGTTGTLTVDGDVTLFANDGVWFDITSTGADKLLVNGEVNMPIGADGIYLSLQSGYTPAVGTSFVLIDNDGTEPVIFDAATPSNYLIPTFLINNQRFQVSFVGGTNRNDVVLTKVAASNTTVSSFATLDATTTYGDPVTFTVFLTGVVDGAAVSFWDGNVYLDSRTVAGAQAAFTTTTLLPGNRQITALFEGNGSQAPVRSAILNQSVAGIATSTGLAVSPAVTSVPDALVTMTATVSAVSGTPAGSVTFYDGAVELATVTVSGGQAIYTTAALIAGSHSLSAYFNPTGVSFASASSAVAHTVTGTTTTTALVTSATPVVAGTNVTFTATVSGGTPTGAVVFRDGAATLGTVALSGATAALTTSGLPTGTRSITAQYLGSTEESPSTSSAVSQVITAAPDGSGTTGGGNVSLSDGGCGLGSGTAALMFALLVLVGLRLRRQ